MTITLAAVYAPIGIQGGLTGALFREFAFTLAGAVIVSGVVALTLSPMMSSKLLRAGDSHGVSRAGSIALRRTPPPIHAAAHQFAALAPGDAHSAAIVILLIVPFFLFSHARTRAEGGPGRDLRHRPGRAEFDHRADDALHRKGERSLPIDAGDEHTFQLTSQRRFLRHGDKAVERAEPHHRADRRRGIRAGRQIAGVRVIATTPEPLPGGGSFPVEFVITSTAEPREIIEFANQLVAKALAERGFILRTPI